MGMVCNSLHHCKNWVMMVSTHACGKNCEHCHGNTIAMPHAVLITCAIAELSRWTDGEYKIGHELLARSKSACDYVIPNSNFASSVGDHTMHGQRHASQTAIEIQMLKFSFLEQD